MPPYTITKTQTGYIARWKDITVEADTPGKAIEAIMKVIKHILICNRK